MSDELFYDMHTLCYGFLLVVACMYKCFPQLDGVLSKTCNQNGLENSSI